MVRVKVGEMEKVEKGTAISNHNSKSSCSGSQSTS